MIPPTVRAACPRPGVVIGLGIWWRKFGPSDTNVNDLTHQPMIVIGRAPSFHDGLVQVEAA
ncbi:MAG: hypothetical protein QFE16_05060 [Pseudomonadota bacterium]|nr:hypothetical protein [Pseudomonadota bacterium]